LTHTFLLNFITTYIEFLVFLLIFCGCFSISIVKEKMYFLYGFIPTLLQTLLDFSPFSAVFILLFSHIIFFLSFFMLFRKLFLHMAIIYVLTYLAIVFLEVIQIPLWSKVTLHQQFVPIYSSFLGLLVACVCYHFAPLARYYQLILQTNVTMILVITDSFFILLGIVSFIRIHMNDFFSHYILILITLLILLAINGEGIINHKKNVERQKELEAYQNYLPIIDSLIDQIRIKQHDYNNNLQSIRALGYTCNDFQSLQNKLLTETDHYLIPDFQMNLLKLNLHLVAGFLISKGKEAGNQSKELHIDIGSYVLSSPCSEYEIIDCLGVLIDNAIEATLPGAIIRAKIASEGNRLIFEIKNPGPALTPDFCRDIFQKGYTTKKTHSMNHGIGLYKLNHFVQMKRGNLILKNEIIENTTYISFQLRI